MAEDQDISLTKKDFQKRMENDDFKTSLQAMLKMEVSAVTRSVHEFTGEVKQDIEGLRQDILGLRNEVSEVKLKCTDIGDRCKHLEKVSSDIEIKLVQTESKLDSLEERQELTSDSVQNVLSATEDLNSRMKLLEDEIDRLEGFSRRNNIRFYGVPEMEKDDYISCGRQIVEILNSAYGEEKQWSMSDIERAHRVGEKHRDKPRTLIAKLFRWSDKMIILNNTAARNKLREKNIRVASDLTRRQVTDLTDIRKRGKFGYFKGGRLVMVDNPSVRFSTRRDTARINMSDNIPRHSSSSHHESRHQNSSDQSETTIPDDSLQKEPQPKSPTPPPSQYSSPSPCKESTVRNGRKLSSDFDNNQRRNITKARTARKRVNSGSSPDQLIRTEGSKGRPVRQQTVHSARDRRLDTPGIQTRTRVQSTRSTDTGRQSRIDSHLQSSRKDI